MKRKLRLPSSCTVNFDFSLDRIECKVCRYFESCLKAFSKAQRLAKNV